MNRSKPRKTIWIRAVSAVIAALLMAVAMTGCFGNAKPVDQQASEAPETPLTASPAPTEDNAVGQAEEVDSLQTEVTVTDIGNSPAAASIAELVSAGIITVEDERFGPNEMITRGEFYEWLIRSDYRDADAAQPNRSAIKDLEMSEEKLLREEIPYIWAAFYDIDYSLTSSSLLLPSVYLDADDIDAEYKKAMAHFVYFEAYQNAFGKTAYLRPKQAVTRAEAADWIIQALAMSDSLKEAVFGGKEGRVTVNLQKVQAPETAEGKADDIADHSFESDIKALLAIVPEALKENSFLPDEAITRGQFIDWMYRYDSKHMKPHQPTEPSFSDMLSDDPLYETIEALKANGLINGFPDGTIRADDPLTREQLTKLWVDYDSPWPFGFVSIIGYEDTGDIGELYERTVSRYIAGGSDTLYNIVFTEGTKRIEPQKAVTRAQAAAWIIRGAMEEHT